MASAMNDLVWNKCKKIQKIKIFIKRWKRSASHICSGPTVRTKNRHFGFKILKKIHHLL